MGNATDDLDRFLRTDGLRILMEAGIRVRDPLNTQDSNNKGEHSHGQSTGNRTRRKGCGT